MKSQLIFPPLANIDAKKENMKNNTTPPVPVPGEKRCPRQHCFFWLEKGDLYASGMHESLEDAIGRLETATESRCECSLGVCIRDERLPPGERDRGVYKDFYEPLKPEHVQQIHST